MILSRENLFRIFVFWLCLFVFFNNPFITDVLMPKAIRYVPPILLMGVYLIYISNFKEKALKMYLLVMIGLFYFFYWLLNDTFIASNALILIYSCIMLYMVISINTNKRTNEILTNVWDKFVWLSIISTVISFFLFNILNRVGYKETTLGNYNEFNTFFNPVLGVVSVRNIVSLTFGRISWFTSEPSYMGFIHGLNIFWFLSRKKKIVKRKFQLGIGLSILSFVFTFSFGSWLSILISIIVFIIFNIILFFLNAITINKKKIIIYIVLILVILSLCTIFYEYIRIAFVFFSDFTSNLDKYSSLDDRSSRIENSANMIKEMDIGKFMFGYGPGSIESMFERGESNGWLKSFIEIGVFPVILYIIVIFQFVLLDRKNLFLFVFLIISFNSIIIMYSPLVIFYLVMLYFQYKKHEVIQQMN